MHKAEDITSPDRLHARMAANQRATVDFDQWCLNQWPEIPAGDVLDLGAGTGKQVRLFGPKLQAGAHFHALDLSPEALAELKDSYAAEAPLHLVEGSFDNLPDALRDARFALVYAAYALYYTSDLPALLAWMDDLLLPGGVFWFIGPAPGNNRAFLDVLEQFYPTDAFLHHVSEGFALDVKAEAGKLGWVLEQEERLENVVPYENAAAFMAYLKNTLYYQPGYDEGILNALEKASAEDGSFQVSKCLVSLQFRKSKA